MAVTIAKPDKYAKCICCGSSGSGSGSDKHDLCEYQLFKGTEVKMCITLCKQCVHQAAVKMLLRDDTEINWR